MFIPTDGPGRTCVAAAQQASLSLGKGGIFSSLPEVSKAVEEKRNLVLESFLSPMLFGFYNRYGPYCCSTAYPQFLLT